MSRSKSPPLNITISNFPHRFFDPENVICGLSFRVPFSRYYVKSKQILSKYVYNKSVINQYVLCPVYGKKQVDKFVPNDVQIGVTGKAKTTEPIKTSVNREIGEELGIVVPYEKIFEDIISDVNNPSLFLIHAKNTILATNYIEKNSPSWSGEDDYDRKIGVCIIGTKEEVTKILTSENFGYRYKNHEEDIIGVIAIPLSIALRQTGFA